MHLRNTVRMASNDLLSTAEVAAYMGRPVRSVQYWAKIGRLPVALQAPGPHGAFFFRRADVDALAALEDATAKAGTR